MPRPWAEDLNVTVPAGTGKKSAKTDTFDFPRGVEIQELKLHFPLGCAAQVCAVISVDGTKQFPQRAAYFAGDDIWLPVMRDGSLEIDHSTSIGLEAWSPNASKEHTPRLFASGEYLCQGRR